MKKHFLFIFTLLITSQINAQSLVLKSAFPDPDTQVLDDYLAHPYDMVICNNHYYIIDAVQSCIKVYDFDGRFIKNIGRRGQGPGELIDPFLIAANSKNNIIIVDDQGNHRLSLFNLEGIFQGAIRTYGSTTSLAISNDKLFVARRYSQTTGTLFACYDTSGELLETFGQIHYPDLTASHPGIFISSENRLVYKEDKLYAGFAYLPFIDIHDDNFKLIKRIEIQDKTIQDLCKENIRNVKIGDIGGRVKGRPWHTGFTIYEDKLLFYSPIKNAVITIDMNGNITDQLSVEFEENTHHISFAGIHEGNYHFVDLANAQVLIYEERR